MRKISEFQDHVAECRKMGARTGNLTHKEQFEEIARAWQMLAEARIKQLERRLLRSHGRLQRPLVAFMPPGSFHRSPPRPPAAMPNAASAGRV